MRRADLQVGDWLQLPSGPARVTVSDDGRLVRQHFKAGWLRGSCPPRCGRYRAHGGAPMVTRSLLREGAVAAAVGLVQALHDDRLFQDGRRRLIAAAGAWYAART